MFSFLPKKCEFYLKKNAILCLFLKNVLPSKRVARFILNNVHLPYMVEGIAIYAQYKSMPCKADDFCLFIGLPDEISPSIVIQFYMVSIIGSDI